MYPFGGRKHRTCRYGNANYPVSCNVVYCRQCKYAELQGNLSPRYGVCTKAMFTLKGRHESGEPKNVIPKFGVFCRTYTTMDETGMFAVP